MILKSLVNVLSWKCKEFFNEEKKTRALELVDKKKRFDILLKDSSFLTEEDIKEFNDKYSEAAFLCKWQDFKKFCKEEISILEGQKKYFFLQWLRFLNIFELNFSLVSTQNINNCLGASNSSFSRVIKEEIQKKKQSLVCFDNFFDQINEKVDEQKIIFYFSGKGMSNSITNVEDCDQIIKIWNFLKFIYPHDIREEMLSDEIWFHFEDMLDKYCKYSKSKYIFVDEKTNFDSQINNFIYTFVVSEHCGKLETDSDYRSAWENFRQNQSKIQEVVNYKESYESDYKIIVLFKIFSNYDFHFPNINEVLKEVLKKLEKSIEESNITSKILENDINTLEIEIEKKKDEIKDITSAKKKIRSRIPLQKQRYFKNSSFEKASKLMKGLFMLETTSLTREYISLSNNLSDKQGEFKKKLEEKNYKIQLFFKNKKLLEEELAGFEIIKKELKKSNYFDLSDLSYELSELERQFLDKSKQFSESIREKKKQLDNEIQKNTDSNSLMRQFILQNNDTFVSIMDKFKKEHEKDWNELEELEIQKEYLKKNFGFLILVFISLSFFFYYCYRKLRVKWSSNQNFIKKNWQEYWRRGNKCKR